MKPIKKDPNNFAMITVGYLHDVRDLAKRSPAAHQLLMLLIERMNRANAVVASQTTLCQILGYKRTSIHNAIRVLEAEKWVQVVKIGTANGYVVNSKVAWKTHKGERYSSFYAEVIISEKDQNRMADSWDGVELRHVPVLKSGERAITNSEGQVDLFCADTINELIGHDGPHFLSDDE